MQPRSEHNIGTDMKILCLYAIRFGLLIPVLYLTVVGLSTVLSKHDYCDDAAMTVKYNLHKPDFTEYGLKSAPECNP